MATWQEIQNNPRLKDIQENRIKILKNIREFFWHNGFDEVDTPISMREPGQEPYLNPIKIGIKDAIGKEYDFYLRTSPEYALKKFLATGKEKIFEIAKCFRNGEALEGTHCPEFTMLEWYRAPGKLSNIMDDTEALFKFVMNKLDKHQFSYRGIQIYCFEKWERVAMKELFQKYLSVNLDEYLETKKIFELAKKLGYQADPNDEYENIFFKIFLNEIEPKLGLEKPIFVYDYPAQMCSLSKLTESDPRYAERFELYIGGLEIANAFGELTDPAEQQKRLEDDRKLRQKLGKEIWSVDPDFIAALGELEKQGREAGGIALGIDRMVVLCTGAKDIKEVIFSSPADQLEI